MIAPDIYIPDAIQVIETYRRPGNPVFVPEIRHDKRTPFEAMYAFGQQDVLGISPFGIDDLTPEEAHIRPVYAALSKVKDAILKYRGTGKMTGLLLDSITPSRQFDLGGYIITASIGKSDVDFSLIFAGVPSKEIKPVIAGGILINIGPDEFILVGKDFHLTLKQSLANAPLPLLDVELMEDGSFINGEWKATRRFNGDESFSSMGGDAGFGFKNDPTTATVVFPSPDEFSVLRFRILKYK